LILEFKGSGELISTLYLKDYMFDSKQNKLLKKFCEKIRKIISQKNSSKT